MPGYELESTPEELEQSRDPRMAAQQLEKLEVAAMYLQKAVRLHHDAGQKTAALEKALKAAQEQCLTLKSKCSGRVEKRRRPRTGAPTTTCTIFLDECGSHTLKAPDDFGVFVLAAVMVRGIDVDVVDSEWRRWKQLYLGDEKAIVHEPDIRRHRNWFKDPKGQVAIDSLPTILGDLDFAALAVVVRRADYLAEFGTDPIDSSLPVHPYLVALDFLMERAVFALDGQFGGARANVVAESRGAKEDADLQHEFSRLHLDGTSYISPAWFRQQLQPGILFLPKEKNDTGLQLADLLARPVGEKVIDPEGEPDRWPVFREKLCPEQQTKHSIVGLKVIPWDECYDGLWKS